MVEQKGSQEEKVLPDSSRKPDPATDFAMQVDAGEIIAGPHVRNTCRRHLEDLRSGHSRGLIWDADAANERLDFFREVLCLNGGEFEGLPFDPEPWQAFIIGAIFGWKNQDGTRRFQTAYVETGKGSGKSPLAAGIGISGITMDGEERAEVYAAATKKDQAMVLFRDAVAMVELSPELDWRIQRSGARGKEWNLAYHETNSFFRPISADDGQSGPRPHIALLDEIHEHRDGKVVEMLRAGTKGRRNPLIFMITNSGNNKQSVCWEYHQYGAEVAAGMRHDDTFFSFVCGLDDDDDPFDIGFDFAPDDPAALENFINNFVAPACWYKANPSLGITIQPKYLLDQVIQAKGMPGKEAVVKRLNFCMWVEGHSPAISYHVWKAAEAEYDERQLYGRRCYAGLDLGSTKDLTALVLLFEPLPGETAWPILPFFWMPSENLAKRADEDRQPYTVWRDKGFLETSPGLAVSRLHVLRRLVQIADKFEINCLAFDRWRIEDLKQLAEDEGISLPPMRPFGQGYKDMGPAVEEFEERLLNGEFLHNGNPVMTMCAANAVWTTDPAGNRKPAKDKAIGRIDGIASAVMAVGASIGEKPKKSVYETRGIRTL